jgi:inhibitor of KinA sporulation pathway (predicted exonuclease)
MNLIEEWTPHKFLDLTDYPGYFQFTFSSKRNMSRILIVDLEATCSENGEIPSEQMETIEMGACWIDLDTGSVLDRFQSFVRPVLNPTLTIFCVGLTGIQQDMVNQASEYPEAARLLRGFVEKHYFPDSTWASWGNYDCKQLERDSLRHGVDAPIVLPHQNAKRLFAKAQRIGKEVGMAKACQLAGLILEGAHHRALDDAINVARLLPWALGTRSIRQ